MNPLIKALDNLIEAIGQTDPTRTFTLRSRTKSHYRAAWNRVYKRTRQLLDDIPADLPEATRIAYFEAEFRRIVNEELTAAKEDDKKGLLAFLLLGFQRGQTLADGDLRKGGVTPLDDGPFYGDEQAATAKLAEADMDGIIAAVVAAAVRAYGANVTTAERLRAIRDRINKVGKTRTESWVEWFIIRAVNVAIVVRGLQHGIKRAGVAEELAYWQTAGDSKVCLHCRFMASQDVGHGPGVYDISQLGILNMIPAHPRCRCRWVLIVG